MKAEHRKELETNTLADQLGRVFHQGKSSPSILWVVLALVVITGGLFWWWTGRAANRLTVSWMDYWSNRSLAEAGMVVEGSEKYKNTPAARAAQLTRGDSLYDQAYNGMFRNGLDQIAHNNFDAAREAYQEVLANPGSSPDLAMRALVGIAKCEECVGELDKARERYQDLINRFQKTQTGPNGTPHPLLQEARNRLDALNAEGGAAAAFYQGWPKRLPKTEMPPPPAPPATAPAPAASAPTLTPPPQLPPPTAPATTAPAASAPAASAPAATTPAATSPAPPATATAPAKK